MIALAEWSPTVRDRLLARAVPEPNTGCWLWDGADNGKGYGLINVRRRRCVTTHIVAYRLFCGEIPDGKEIDHVCRTRCCCNPDHLEAVTHTENVNRRPIHPMAARTHCVRGHPYSGQNLVKLKNGKRGCRSCQAIASKAYHLRKKERQNAHG